MSAGDELHGREVQANGLRFFLVDEGAGPAVLLLHGFPDTSSLWRHQVPALVGAGYRVLAPDERFSGAGFQARRRCPAF